MKRIDDDRTSGLKHGAQILEHLGAQAGKLLAAVIDDGAMHRTLDAIGDVGGPGDLQEMAAGVYQDDRILIDCEQRSRPSIVEARVLDHAAPGLSQDQRRDHSPESHPSRSSRHQPADIYHCGRGQPLCVG